ncbi:lipopolysaccharide biosynthesis protein [Oceaniradius stylonematis]|uniref:lipopolysaccharide biosynthesis protein n=1 Tax=Oceaniradius stylonematis TaxID=2184161 RepID=UPI00273ECB1A|nr:lipopolysaccharide biosynthesis protein [Oceaniradius stylonematis]MCR9195465.1 lipopolysaccharide biosynthesis protein [Hyphomonas sp.]
MTKGADSYWRNVALVFSGTAIAQLIPLLGSLVIARLFIPAEFGIFMSWLGISAVVGVFSTCRFEMALALEPDGPPRAAAAMATVLTTLAMVTGVVLLGLVAYQLLADRLASLPSALIVMFPAAFLALTGSQIWQAWAAAEGLFKALSFMRILQATTITGLQIGLGFVAPSATALAAAHLAGVAAGIIVMMFWLPPRRLEGGIGALVGFWSRYRKFPMFSLPADSVNTLAAQLPLLVIAGRFGAEAAGFVALAFRTLGAPISLMGTAVLDVFKRRASSAWRTRGDCRAEYVQTAKVLAAGSVAASLVFFLAGEELFVFAFGEDWRGAGQAAVILLPLFALRFVASPLSYTIYIAEKQQLDLIWQLVLLGMTLATLFLPQAYAATLLAYAIGYSLLYVAYISLTFRLSRGTTA